MIFNLYNYNAQLEKDYVAKWGAVAWDNFRKDREAARMAENRASNVGFAEMIVVAAAIVVTAGAASAAAGGVAGGGGTVAAGTTVAETSTAVDLGTTVTGSVVTTGTGSGISVLGVGTGYSTGIGAADSAIGGLVSKEVAGVAGKQLGPSQKPAAVNQPVTVAKKNLTPSQAGFGLASLLGLLLFL